MRGALPDRRSSLDCQLVSKHRGPSQIRQVAWLGTCTPRCCPSLLQALFTAHHPPLLSACSAAKTTGTYNTEEQEQQTVSPARLRAQKGGTPKQKKPLVKPEVLAPAGGWPQVKAACENGADAVYFGTPDFNARARASNFEASELRELMAYLHARGVKGYVALNVLVFDEELEALEQRIREVAAAGVDALIVQDLGAVELIRRVAPGLPIHGSTQMSITSAQGAQFAAGLGVERIVVGRELSIKEIAKVREQSTAEVEAFVHGALCVSYSGQCFSSEAWGGRSANRGQCAQACRLPYGLIVDDMLKDLQDISYLLSPQDLMAVSQVPELINSGVGCFKIEGRLKGPEYVALTTQVYRRAVDAAWAALTDGGDGIGTQSSINSSSTSSSVPNDGSLAAAKASVALTQQEQWDLEQVFARGQDADFNGLTPGFLEGPMHQRLVRGRAPKHRGLYAGTVVRILHSNNQQQQQQQQQWQQHVRSHASSSGSGRGGGGGGSGGGGMELRGGKRSGAQNGVGGRKGSQGQWQRSGNSTRVRGSQGQNGGKWGGGFGQNANEQESRASSSSSSSSSSSVAVMIEVACPLKRGDGLVFDAGQVEQLEEGGSVYDLQDAKGRQLPGRVVPPGTSVEDSPDAQTAAQLVKVVFGPGQIDPSRVQEGQLVWRTKDAGLESRLRASYENLAAADLRRQEVQATVKGQLGEPMTLILRDASGHEVRVQSAAPLAPAANRPMTEEDVVRALGVTLGGAGDNTLALASTDFSGLQLSQGLFMPASDLKSLRRAGTEALLAAREASHTALQGRVAPVQGVVPSMLAEVASRSQEHAASSPATTESGAVASSSTSSTDEGAAAVAAPVQGSGRRQAGGGKQASISVLCRTPEQVEACLSLPWLQEVVLDFLEVQGLWEAVAAVKGAGKRVIVATPRVLKPNEEPLVAFYLRLRADALLLRSAGLLYTLSSLGGPGTLVPGLLDPKGNPVHVPELHGDFSLNVANTLSADLLLRGSSLSRIAPTHDLSAPQICSLATSLGPSQAAASLEVILHQHLPIFHTEHCVFCRFLSTGNSYKDCGHPCEQHKVHLRDEKGADHLVLADMGCRNTVFNAQAQSGAFYVQDLVRAGVRKFRVELVDEESEIVVPLVQGYRDLLDGGRSSGDLWTWMGSLSSAGVGAGSLEGARARDRGASTLRSTAAALKEEARRKSSAARTTIKAGAVLTAQ